MLSLQRKTQFTNQVNHATLYLRNTICSAIAFSNRDRTDIGRIPPSFLVRAIKRPPKTMVLISLQHHPASGTLTRSWTSVLKPPGRVAARRPLPYEAIARQPLQRAVLQIRRVLITAATENSQLRTVYMSQHYK